MKTLLKIVFVLFIGTTVITSSFAAGYGTRWYFYRNVPTEEEAQSFAVFWEAIHILERDFYGELPGRVRMAYGAIRGVLGLLDDPHTVLVEPEPRRLEKDNLKGSFGGIGAYILRNEEGQVTIKVMADSPALRAGLEDDDAIIAVDGRQITPEMSEEDIVVLIRGPVGSKVTLTIERFDIPEPFDVEITREKIETPTVAWEMVDDDIGYVAISLFGEQTNRELKRALTEMKKNDVRGLILDLRNNPGGLLDAAVAASGQFMGRRTVLHERKRDGESKPYTSSEDVVVPNASLVVLVNAATASASEIVAGALRDNLQVPLIGERTFGKGSVQLVYDLSDGSSLHVTTAEWFTPNHHQIQGQGLMPDVEVQMHSGADNGQEGADAQLEAAIRYLRQQLD